MVAAFFNSIWEYTVYTGLALGVVLLALGFFFGFLPVISRYKLPLQVAGIALFSMGLWFGGRIAKDKEWRLETARLQAELERAKTAAAKVTIEEVEKVVYKKQVIKEKGDTIIKWIQNNPESATVSCTVPNYLITGHNAAALNDTALLTGLPPGTPVDPAAANAAARGPIKLAPKK